MKTCDPPSRIAGAIIPVSRAREMYNEYQSRRVGIIQQYENIQQGITDFKATRYAEFDYEKLKDYMDYLECINDNLQEDGSDKCIKTLRLYYTNYPNATTHTNGTPVKSETDEDGNTYSYKGRTTIILAPTTEINDRNQCFLYKNTQNSFEIVSFDGDDGTYQSILLNEAGLTPPPPKEHIFGQ